MICSYRTPQEVDPLARRTTNTKRPAPCARDHYPVAIEDKKQVACAVCLLEYRWKKILRKWLGSTKMSKDAPSVGFVHTLLVVRVEPLKGGRSILYLNSRL